MSGRRTANNKKRVKSLDQEQSLSVSGDTPNTNSKTTSEQSSVKKQSSSSANSKQNVGDRIKIEQLVNASKEEHLTSIDPITKNQNNDLKLYLSKAVASPGIIAQELNNLSSVTSPGESARFLSPNNGNSNLPQSHINNFGQMFPFNFKPRGSLTLGSLPIPNQQSLSNVQRASVTNLSTLSNSILDNNQIRPLKSTSPSHDSNLRGAENLPSTKDKDATVDDKAAITTTSKQNQAKKPSSKKRAYEKTTDTEAEVKVKKPRKKRKVYSCEDCRKMKTRCDFQPLIAKCHRCVILDIPCSLGEDRKEDIKQALEAVNKTGGIKSVFENKIRAGEINTANIDQLIGQNSSNEQNKSELENTEILLQLQNTVSFFNNRMDQLDDKLNTIINHITSHSQTDTSSSHNTNSYILAQQMEVEQEPPRLNNHGVTVENPPFRLLDQIERELLGTFDDNNNSYLTEKEILAKAQRAWVVARQKFMQFFYNHEELCFKLAHAFLKKAHFWIIPGGIKTIDRDYVEKHPFITSVFAIIAMGFDENENFSTEQEILYPIVERLLSNTLTMFDQLHDHDIEAILYISMYTISRKSKKFRQVKFDGLILSKFASDYLLNLIDFYKIKENCENGLFDGNDLFHLRILNSLTTIKMIYSIGYCNFSVQDRQLRDFNDLTVRFPQSTFGDEIKLGEIKLGDIVNGIFLNFEDFYQELLKSNNSGEKKSTIKINEMRNWLDTYKELSSKDGSNLLLFTYDFYYIVVCRNLICDFGAKDYNQFLQQKDFFIACLDTVKKYCFAILTSFLKLPTSLIKGAPIITLQQTVYSCLSLCDFLHCFNPQEKARILNLCTKIYWHLNSIGEKLNEATQNVGIIIKTLIDSSMVHTSNPSNSSSEMDLKNLFIKMQKGSKHNSIKRKKKKSSNKNKDNHSSITSVSSNNRNSKSNPYTPGTASSVNTISSTNTPLSGTMNQNSISHNSHLQQFNFGSALSLNSLNFPDVEQFQSFEDFFQDFFHNSLKPTSQNMFQGK